MREILFRGKRKNNGEWIEGYYCKIDDRSMIAQMPIDCDTSKYMYSGYWLGAFYEIEPATVCEYTDRTDKNGKRIFKGDIIREYHDILAQAQARFLRTSSIFPDDCKKIIDCSKYEVIGNIYDNPELVKVRIT